MEGNYEIFDREFLLEHFYDIRAFKSHRTDCHKCANRVARGDLHKQRLGIVACGLLLAKRGIYHGWIFRNLWDKILAIALCRANGTCHYGDFIRRRGLYRGFVDFGADSGLILRRFGANPKTIHANITQI